MESPILLAIEALSFIFALVASGIWIQIYSKLSDHGRKPPRELTLATLLLSASIVTHVVEEQGTPYGAWFEVMTIVFLIAASSFFLDASFEIAEGRL